MTTKFGNDDKVILHKKKLHKVGLYDATFVLSGSQFFVLNCEPETKNVAS
jgi:hypothetical protein